MQFSGGPDAKPKHHTGKRKRKATACPDQRREYGHCGICGSGNTASQGVAYCTKCGAETDYLTTNWRWWQQDLEGAKVPCVCIDEWSYRTSGGRQVHRSRRPIRTASVAKCLDCGAVMSSFCPNNPRHDCWHHWDGRTYCRNCGFRQDERR